MTSTETSIERARDQKAWFITAEKPVKIEVAVDGKRQAFEGTDYEVKLVDPRTLPPSATRCTGIPAGREGSHGTTRSGT